MKRLVCIIFTSLLGCSRPEAVTRFDSPDTKANTTIRALREAIGTATLTVSDSVVVEGRVTATDNAGNFYKEFYIDDGSAAMSILAGGFDLHNIYPPGIKIAVKLHGLALCTSEGVLRCGLPAAPGSMYETDYMQHKAVCDKYIVRTSDKCEVRPLCIAISEMDYSMCGRLVTVQSLLHADTLPHWYDTADYTSYSLRKFKDACGDSVNVTTSRYALFADKPIPSERVTVTGILSFDGRCYKIKPRDETDIGIR